MVVPLLCIRLFFLGRNLFCILVLYFGLFLGIFLAYICFVLGILYLFRMLCPQVNYLIALEFQ